MTSTVEVTCLCGKITETLQLDSPLPVASTSCCCNSCQHSTGALYYSDLRLVSKPATVSLLTKYDSSSHLSRYFCPSCGSPFFIQAHGNRTWNVSSGVIDRVQGYGTLKEHSLEQLVQHEFVADTIDGGLVICLDQFNGKPIPFFMQGPDSSRVAGSPAELLKSIRTSHRASLQDDDTIRKESSANTEMLQASCHCMGVRFQITRPTAASGACSSPWPDLIVPYHASSSENQEDRKWWLRDNDTKYLAGTCACRSCRLASGSPIQAWAFVPKTNILQLDGQPLDYGMGTLQQIESSSGCYRNFCAVCGATVFWHSLERPHVVDVSVGLLRAPEGARASSWLDWLTERVSFKEHAFDKKLIEQLEKGLQNIKLANSQP